MTMMLHEALGLLGVSTINGSPQQLLKFCVWIEDLSKSNGKEWVTENREVLLKQWDYILRQEQGKTYNK